MGTMNEHHNAIPLAEVTDTNLLDHFLSLYRLMFDVYYVMSPMEESSAEKRYCAIREEILRRMTPDTTA